MQYKTICVRRNVIGLCDIFQGHMNNEKHLIWSVEGSLHFSLGMTENRIFYEKKDKLGA